MRNTHLGSEIAGQSADGQIHLNDGLGRPLGLSGSGFRIDPGAAGPIILEGTPYRGSAEFFVNPLGVPVVVNELPLEDYLMSVVPGELGPKQFPEPEALKAQSVAARTFALSELGSRARHGYDLFRDVRSQVYGGLPVEQDASNRAVEDTRGLFASYAGRPIVAFFSSTCGGVTASYQETFQKTWIPYLKGGVRCPDDKSRYASWRESLEVARLQVGLDRYAGVGRLRDLGILKRDSTGRVAEMRFTGDQGEKVLKGLQVRYALGLKSHFITELRVIQDDRGYARRLEVRGRGFGHGVGMCQVGAFELALQGRSFGQILSHYYPGITIEHLADAGQMRK